MMPSVTESPSLSVVVPVYNEEGNLRPLYTVLCHHLGALGMPFEVIFVNDGSRDRSLDVMRDLCAADPRVKAISLSRNFGHQHCLTAGVDHASGDAVIAMDADLQHPPELIPQMVAKWREGYQVVYTLREEDAHAGLLKRWTSAAFYRCINMLSEVPIVPGAADFRLLDRAVVDCLDGMPERARFLRGMVSWVGFRQIGIPYAVHKRFSGTSKYTFRKMFHFAVQGVTSFSTIPLRVATYMGVLIALSVIPYAIWAIYARLFTDQAEAGWASLVVSVLFLGGVQLIALGVMGEYVGQIYTEVKRRPLYIAAEYVGFDDSANRRMAAGHGVGRIARPYAMKVAS